MIATLRISRRYSRDMPNVAALAAHPAFVN